MVGAGGLWSEEGVPKAGHVEDILEEETPEGGHPEDVLDPGQLEGVVWRVQGAIGRGKHPVHGHAGPKMGPRERQLEVGATRTWA